MTRQATTFLLSTLLILGSILISSCSSIEKTEQRDSVIDDSPYAPIGTYHSVQVDDGELTAMIRRNADNASVPVDHIKDGGYVLIPHNSGIRLAVTSHTLTAAKKALDAEKKLAADKQLKRSPAEMLTWLLKLEQAEIKDIQDD